MNQIFKTQNEVRIYDFKECLKYLDQLGKQKFGPHFEIRQDDSEIIYKLLVYAIGDKENCAQHNIDLNKGILLLGPVGCGKTSLMTILKPFFSIEQQYVIKPSRDVSFEFISNGYQTILKYGKMEKNYYFDDLGAEKSLKHFGNKCNTMGEILLSRYDLFTQQKILTHATTNLNAQELEKLYGNRVRSRLREMFNLIAFDKSILDKRK